MPDILTAGEGNDELDECKKRVDETLYDCMDTNINDWEVDFLESISRQLGFGRMLSKAQLVVFERIEMKVNHG